MMMNSGASCCNHVVLSAESTERSTTHLCQIFDVTCLLCHPDLSGLRIYDPVPGAPTGLGSTLQDGVCRLRLGRLLAPVMIDCSVAIGHVSAYLVPAAAQSDNLLGDGSLVRLRLGRLLAFGTIDCLGAIGRTSAQLGSATVQ